MHKIQYLAATSLDRSPSSVHGRLLSFWVTLALVVALIGLTSCAGYTSAGKGGGNPGSSTGVLSASSSSVTFGNVAVGNSKTQSISVTNTGTATVNISQATITGAGYTVVGGNPSSSIPAGQSSTIQVQLTPLSPGVDTGSLSVVSDASNSPLTVALTGTGTEAVLAMSPASINFGNVKVGQSGSQTVQLTNSGNVDLVGESRANLRNWLRNEWPIVAIYDRRGKEHFV